MEYKRMREETRELKNINDVIKFAKLHYRKLTREDRAKIFNEAIQDRQINLEEFKFSLRLSNQNYTYHGIKKRLNMYLNKPFLLRLLILLFLI
ncbi:hypothetical protein IIS_05117 [Bacillus cereus VD131]|nr:hypothetical protein IIS_05117 [Bacillus cereus VD131]